MTQTVLVIGATSAIAEAVTQRFAKEGGKLVIIARNSEKLRAISSHCSALGAGSVHCYELDANHLDDIEPLLHSAWAKVGQVDVALIAHGTLPDQQRCEQDLSYAIKEFRTNAESVIACMTVLANLFEKQGQGVLAVIGSVAGDRGRASNALYGASKAAVDAFASGVRSRLYKKGVHVLTIKPGFVATPMTEGLGLPARLTAKPETVARDIERAIRRRCNIIYTPFFWRAVMFTICKIPEALFKRIHL